jgi:DNA-binding transcriptional LysR family regulator
MFQAIVQSGSFTKAGEKLYVSQSAISRQIKLLEDELGDKVFTRVNKRVVLTRAGEILMKYSNRLFHDLKDMISEIEETNQLTRGSIRIGGVMSVCTYLLPHVLKKYRTFYPRVELTVSIGNSEKIIRQLRANEIDLGLLTLPVEQSDLQAVPVLEEEMVVVTNTKHTLARRKQVAAQDLSSQRFILFEKGCVTRKVVDQFFAEQDIVPQIVMEIENVEIIKELVQIGLGITIVPYQSVIREVRAKRLQFARIGGKRLYREIGLVHLKSNYVPRSLHEMLKVFKTIVPHVRGVQTKESL